RDSALELAILTAQGEGAGACPAATAHQPMMVMFATRGEKMTLGVLDRQPLGRRDVFYKIRVLQRRKGEVAVQAELRLEADEVSHQCADAALARDGRVAPPIRAAIRRHASHKECRTPHSFALEQRDT